jgi:hypothetical protein
VPPHTGLVVQVLSMWQPRFSITLRRILDDN